MSAKLLRVLSGRRPDLALVAAEAAARAADISASSSSSSSRWAERFATGGPSLAQGDVAAVSAQAASLQALRLLTLRPHLVWCCCTPSFQVCQLPGIS